MTVGLFSSSARRFCVCVYVCVCVCVCVCECMCACLRKTTLLVSMCHTQFDFGVLCEQNILSLNVSVNHMMGVKMGKTLEDKHTQNTHKHTHTVR